MMLSDRHLSGLEFWRRFMQEQAERHAQHQASWAEHAQAWQRHGETLTRLGQESAARHETAVERVREIGHAIQNLNLEPAE